MIRRTFIAASLATATAVPVAQGAAGIQVIYIGGSDCPNCTKWKNQYKADWEASPDFKKVKWVMVDPPSLRQAYNSRNWPDDLKPILEKLPQKSGTPRFLVIKDGAIIANKDGVASWLTILGIVKQG
jgi:hypothetical protein